MLCHEEIKRDRKEKVRQQEENGVSAAEVMKPVIKMIRREEAQAEEKRGPAVERVPVRAVDEAAGTDPEEAGKPCRHN